MFANPLNRRIIFQALAASTIIVTFLASLYFVIEPQVGLATNTRVFTISQTIGAEISMAVVANVVATGTISGLTGGNATGTTQAVVTTNNSLGYTMNISFADPNGDGTIMQRDLLGSSTAAIRNYATSSPYNRMVTPSYGFSLASTAAMFAYTVTASNTNDISQNFLHNGSSLCGTGSNTTPDVCWMAPTTTAYQIIQSGSPAPNGSTSTLKFRIYVPNSPNPAVETGTYTATATLTAVNI